MVFAGAEVVPGPARAPLPYGLFSVLVPRPEGEGRWQNGVQWEPLTCAPVSGIGPSCEPGESIGLPKSFADGGGVGEASPFAVYGSYVCSPVGRTIEEAQERATLHLINREEAGVEAALWTGALGNTPNLRNAVVLGGGAVDVVEGMGLLEDYLATEYGSLGVLHMTRGGATSAANGMMAMREGARLVSALGTPIVAGAGYDGSSPEGAAATDGTTWLYATPALFGYRSEIFPSVTRGGDLLDRGENNLYAIAERNYVLGWDDCGVAAVQINLGCC